MDDPLAILAGGVAYALPPGSRAVPAASVRPMPLVGSGSIALAIHEGQGVPVLHLQQGAAEAWARLPSGMLVSGAALARVRPEGALALPEMSLVARAPLPALPVLGGAAWAVPARRGRSQFSTLAVEIGPLRVLLPFALVQHVLPMPALRAAPAMPPGVAGYAMAEGGPAVVLDPAGLLSPSESQALSLLPQATLLVLFSLEGRSIGLPCQRVGPAAPGEVADMRGIATTLAAFGAAPSVTTSPAPIAEARCGLLLCSAAGVTFAVAVEEVSAVIAPVVPTPATTTAGARRGRVVAHRGDVLPVLDAGLHMAGRPVLADAGSAAPLLRLLLPHPVALAVSDIAGLRQVRLSAIAAAQGSALVAGIAVMPEGAVPICRAAALAGFA